MALPVELLLPIITVLATIRALVTNWFRSRAVPRPVRDLTVGSPVQFDDLTSECNKQEVRQHDYYDRRKERLNSKEKKYAVVADDPDNVPKDQYTNEALETLFSQAVGAGKGLDALFEPKANHEQKSSDPKDTNGGDSKEDTAAKPADKAMLPREAEARELYKLYKMPPKPTKNNDQISVASTDSLDSQVRLPWRQWINYLRSKTFSFGLRNPFRHHAKTCKDKPKAGTAGKEAGRTGSEERKEGSTEGKSGGNTSKTKSKNPLRNWLTKHRGQKKLSFEQTNVATKEDDQDDDKTNNVLTKNNQEKVQPLTTPASMYGPSTMPLPKLLGSAAQCNNQPSHSVEPIQPIIKPRSEGTNEPVPSTKKTKKGKRLAWFTSRSKKARQKSKMTITNRPEERRDV